MQQEEQLKKAALAHVRSQAESVDLYDESVSRRVANECLPILRKSGAARVFMTQSGEFFVFDAGEKRTELSSFCAALRRKLRSAEGAPTWLIERFAYKLQAATDDGIRLTSDEMDEIEDLYHEICLALRRDA